MTEHILNIQIKLFAYITSFCNEREAFYAKSFIEVFLVQQFTVNTVNSKIDLFDEELTEYKKNNNKSFDEAATITKQILTFCTELNSELLPQQKYHLLLYLFEFIKIQQDNTSLSVIRKSFDEVATLFKINPVEFEDLKCFVFDQLHNISDKKSLLIVSGLKFAGRSGIKYIFKAHLKGQLVIIKNNSINAYLFKINGNDQLTLNDWHLYQHHVYFFQKGLAIRCADIQPVYYSDIEQYFAEIVPEKEIEFKIDSIEYRFNETLVGMHKFSISAYSGQMNAVVGGSGTGKTTLMNLMNGTLQPNSAQILVNNFDIHTHKDKIRGLIGFVPQDDLLFEELTVFENLYYNAKLCFGNLTDEEIIEKTEQTLKTLELFDIKHLKVGSALNKLISGGQRKRLNIALELIREPAILFIDEPTSGLSSADSLKMVDLLKQQALKGKLVFMNIHQPSSAIFKNFDKLLILDRGGYPIYWGNPVESLSYFKQNLNLVDAEQNECLACGNVNPDDILQLIEYKQINKDGVESELRKFEPENWYELFINKVEENVEAGKKTYNNLVENKFNPPSNLKQFLIFSKRNLMSKLANKQYMLISLLETPLLAMILGFFLRQTNVITHLYNFSENENLPSYLFMSIIVAMFIGMIVSSEEIVKDRTILKREAFLSLSHSAYINSKVFYLLLLSSIQMLTYVILGNLILEIKGMTFGYFIVLWSVACFANVLGLVISNSLKTVIAIYITIPFLLIPQILLAGVVVNFDKLHHWVASQETVPVISDLMASRWAYEALAVNQFKNNDYEQFIFDVESKISDAVYRTNFVIPELYKMLTDCETFISQKDNSQALQTTENKLNIITNQLIIERNLLTSNDLKLIDSLTVQNISQNAIKELYAMVDKQMRYFAKLSNDLQMERQRIIKEIVKNKGKAYFVNLKQQYFNDKLSEVVLNSNDLVNILNLDNKLIRKFQPIFQLPENKMGRAHFYSPVKRIGNYYVDTFWFNISVIWLMTIGLYIMLLRNIFSKLLTKVI